MTHFSGSTRRWARALLWVSFIALAWAPLSGCEDSSPTGAGGEEADAHRPGSLLLDQGFVGGQGGQGGGEGGQGGDGGDGGDGGQGGDGGEGGDGGQGGQGGDGGQGGQGGHAGECVPATARCLSEGGELREICREDSRWALIPCDDGGVCYDGLCMPSAAECVAGEHLCRGQSERLACDPSAQRWVPGEACGADELCRDGQCVPAGCARAQAEFSYLGCEYYAVDLPNGIFESGPGGTTPDSPIGVVLANPSETRPAAVTIRAPSGQPVSLVNQTTVRVPNMPDLPIGMYQDQPLTSHVRDASGQIIQDRVGSVSGLEIPPGGIATFLLPKLGDPVNSSGVVARAFHIETDSPVAAYQFSPLCCNFSFSNDASLLIPVHAYGGDYRFLGVPSWRNPDDIFGVTPGEAATLTVVSPQADTEVNIQLPQGLNLRPDQRGRVTVRGTQATARLGAGEVLMLQANVASSGSSDLSGANITSSAPVGVFSSHSCSFYPNDQAACDHLQEQLFPTSTWGREFALTPTQWRGARTGTRATQEAVYWKIMARETGARVTLSRPYAELNAKAPGFREVPDCRNFLEADGQTLVMRERGLCEFGTMEAVGLSSDTPLMVMGIISAQNTTRVSTAFGAEAGDPSIFLLPPDNQYRDDYVFLTPGTYAKDYVTIVADADIVLTLDGEPVSLAGASPVPGTGRVYHHILLEDGPHRLVGSSPFGIVVYAFDDFVSYAFTGGLNLIKR